MPECLSAQDGVEEAVDRSELDPKEFYWQIRESWHVQLVQSKFLLRREIRVDSGGVGQVAPAAASCRLPAVERGLI